jgi:hypothetical protein
MKTLKLSIIALAIVMIGIYSCQKSNDSSSASVTADQAADIAAGSLAENSNGLASITDNISANALADASTSGQSVNSVGTSSVHQECGTTLSDSASNAGSADSVSWNYSVKYSRTLNCNAQSQPDNTVTTVAYSGNYDGPNVSSTNSGTAHFTIAGLTQAAANYVLNGEYKRSGSFTSKVGNKNSYSSDVDIVATNVTLSKPGRRINGGSATINITGTSPKGSFTYTGTIVFNSGSSAVLTINGNSYTIDLHTGFKIKRK